MTKQERASRGLRWGRALLLGGLVAGPARAADCALSGASLDVVTYNTWGLPEPIARDRDERMPRIAALVREEQADLTALQEVWRGSLQLLDLDLLRSDEAGDNGLALVTPHPVTGRRVIAFEDAAGVDRIKAKGALVSTVRLPELGETTVVVTHLQAGPGPRAAAVRARQVEAVLRLTEDETQPTILMGDFNLHADSRADQATAAALAARGWQDLAEQRGDPRPTFIGKDERFDRILVRAGPGRCVTPLEVQVPQIELSDHLPVRAIIGVGNR